jgi:hypothetical protein
MLSNSFLRHLLLSIEVIILLSGISCSVTNRYKMRILNSTNYFLHNVAIYNSDNVSFIDIAPSDTSIILHFSYTISNYERLHGYGCITMEIASACSLYDTINNNFRSQQCINITSFSESNINIISINKVYKPDLKFEYTVD